MIGLGDRQGHHRYGVGFRLLININSRISQTRKLNVSEVPSQLDRKLCGEVCASIRYVQ